jgi:signal transduction histidine kinase
MPKPTNTQRRPAQKSSDAVDARLKQLQEDLRRVKRQLRHAQRLASLGTTAALLAHETNNLLTPVLGYTTGAIEEKDPKLADKALQVTARQIELVMAMTNRVLGMAADEPVEFSEVLVAEVVDGALQCLCRDLRKDNITLTVDVPPDATVHGNAQQLQQIFFNLLVNARDALRERSGRIDITARPIDDGRIEIQFKDTGSGIAPEHLDHVFEDFFTTKNGSSNKRHCGSGLGLSVCRDIIKEHGGRIGVTSQPQHGTTFTIVLPSAQ